MFIQSQKIQLKLCQMKYNKLHYNQTKLCNMIFQLMVYLITNNKLILK